MTIHQVLVLDNSQDHLDVCGRIFNEYGIRYDAANSDMDIWRQLTTTQKVYDVILIARCALGRNVRSFVSHLRSLNHYASIPLLLMMNDMDTREEDVGSFYFMGFTHIFGRDDFHFLKHYIVQAKTRDTFEKTRQNKVIIIEDDPGQQLVVQATLEEKHCECFCFLSAEEALSDADHIDPHLIVCDFFLGGA